MAKVTIARIQNVLAKSNDGIKPNVEWVCKMKPMKGFNGYTYRLGIVNVSYNGFRTRRMTVTQDHDSLMIR